MARYNTAPVPPEKIQLIKDCLNDPEVNAAWLELVNMQQVVYGSERSLIKTRFQAWHRYVVARDKFLGLPTINPHFLIRLDNNYGK